MVKKLLVVLALISSVGTANAVSAIRYNHRMQPMTYHYVPHNEYNRGYHDGKHDEREKVVKTVAGVVLISVSAIVLYEALKPSDNINGHVRIAQF